MSDSNGLVGEGWIGGIEVTGYTVSPPQQVIVIVHASVLVSVSLSFSLVPSR